MFSDFRESLVAVLSSYGRRFRGTGQPVTFADTAQMSQPQTGWRVSAGRSVRHYFTRLQNQIQKRHWRCAARVQELMAQPRRRQTAALTTVEAVERRLLLSAVTVDTALDVVDATDGLTSLREALIQTNDNASGFDSITFGDGSAVVGGTDFLDATADTITLERGELAITGDVTITGSGADLLTIVADNQSRIFNINDGNNFSQSDVSISGLKLTGGNVSGTGGAIFLERENLTVSHSTISENSTSSWGGGIANSDGTLSVSNSTISGNTAHRGGGIWSYGTDTVRNSTISGNEASSRGGGIWSYGNLTVSNSTISGNEASSRGGGINASSYATLTVSNSIVAGNTLTGGSSASDIVGTTVTGSFNLIGDAATAGGLIDDTDGNIVGVDWKDVLVNNGTIPTLTDNGGPTQTIALLPDSPAAINAAINAGNDALLPTGTDYDQRGTPFARIFDGTVDIGAYELQPQALSLVVDTDSDDVDGDYSLGNLSLREAVELTNANPGFSHTILFGDGSAVIGGTDFNDAFTDTITLGGTELAITGDVTITGSGADLLTIDADNESRIFNVDDGNNSSQSDVEISGLTLTGGSADGSAPSKWGGAIYTIEELTVSNSTISGNMAGFGGAIFVNFAGTTTVGNSTISGNDATYGGGIFNNNQGTLTVNNSTISGNTATRSGGGINNGKYGTTTVSNSTITGNTARKIAEGGGIFNHGNNVNSDSTTISNSIVAGNTADGSLASDIGGAVTGTFNLIGTGGSGGLVDGNDGNQVGIDWTKVLETTIDASQNTVPNLTDNGGPTQTIALLADSLALNAGDPSAVAGVGGVPEFDQRGAPFARIVGGTVDIGAYEAQTLSLLVDTDSDVVDGDYSLGNLSLREAVELTNANPGADSIRFGDGLAVVGGTDFLDAIADTITLTDGELAIIGDVTITGSGADLLTIVADNQSRIFNINDNNNASQSIVEISGLKLTGGNVTGDGGAIYTRENLTVSNSTISGNSAKWGGAIFVNFAGTATVSNSTISGNTARRGGGISNFDTATVSNSTISGNTADYGGGISNVGTATVSNSTISGNTADYSGGILNYHYGTLTVSNSTISGNTANYGGGGGGIVNHGNITVSNSVTVSNSIVAGNTNGGAAGDIGGAVTGSFNLIGDAATAGGLSNGTHDNIVGVDWKTVLVNNGTIPTLTDNGGPTQTIALLVDSPALNNGSNDLLPADTDFDQRGTPFARIVGGIVDIGAYEAQPLSLVVDTNTDVVDGDYSAGNLSLREAVELTNANPGADTLTFGDGSAVVGGTDFNDTTADSITLTNGELAITGDVTITGSGAELLTIDANNLSRIFNINDGNNASQSSVEISGLTLTGGSANGSAPSKWGGAIYTIEELTVSNSTISGNMAGFGGAIFVNFAGTTTVGNSTISGNDATYGGGIFNNNQGTLTVNNSTISGNTATRSGGGINNGKYGTTTVSNSTITGNTARKIAEGGGIFNHGNNVNTTVTISNSIVAGNTFNNGASDIGGAVTGSFNLIGDAATAGGLSNGTHDNIVGVDWKTVLVNNGTIPTLTDNGGPTQTIALLVDSPALNNGSNDLLPADTDFDQRGAPFARIVGGIVDIGAYENENTAPVANDLSVSGDEDNDIIGQLTASDAESNPVNFVGATSPTNGSVVVNSDGTFTYTPNDNFNGADSFTFTVSDGSLSDTGTINITVAPVNDPGTFTGDTSATTDEDTPTNGQLTFTDTADGDTFPNFRIEPGDEPANGTANIDGPTGLWSYSPADDFNGSDTFTVSVTDDDGNVETLVINITVNAVNDDGTFTGNTSVTTDEDTATSGTLTFTDAADGFTTNFTVSVAAANGTAVINDDGDWTYTPADNFNGSDNFTVSVTDDDGNVETQVINITVNAVNDDGTFTGNTSVTTDEDTATTGTLTFTDAADGFTNPNYSVSTAANGTAAIDATGDWTYTPADNFNGSDSFTVSVTDDDGNEETQVINITVTQINDPGIFGGNTSSTTDEDTATSGTLTFTDAADGFTTNFTVSVAAANGTAAIDATGDWTYTPADNFNGSDSFTVSITDDDGNVETQVISIDVTQINDPGTFDGNTSVTTDEDTGTSERLTFTDAADGFTTNFTVSVAAANGTAVINDDGDWTYTPADNFNGSDNFTVSVTDDDGNVETQVINITVNAVNDDGTFTGNTSVTTDEDTATTGTLTFTDAADGFTNPNYSVSTAANGTAAIDATGDWTYTPADNFNGSDSFTVSVTDDDGNEETQVINITVTQINDPGIFGGNTSSTTDEDTATSGTLTFTDAADGFTTNFTVSVAAANGTAVINDDGDWTYTPADNFNGSDSFTVSVTDDDGNVETQVISIDVTQINDPGTFDGNTSVTTDEDTGTSERLTFTDAADGFTTNFTVSVAAANGTAAIDATGDWTYTPADNFNGSDNFTVSVTDDDGNVETQVISITVIPVNDAPTIEVTAAAGFREETDAAAQHLQQSGIVSFDDVDATDLISISATSNNDVVWSGGAIDPALAAQLVAGFSTGVTDAEVPGSTSWNYDVEGVDLRFLDGGETISFSYTVTATDTQNATADATVQFVITGTTEVQVAVVFGELIVVGDAGSNVITVEARPGFVSVEGGEFTIVTYACYFNDGAGFNGNVWIFLGDGSDDLTISEESELPDQLVIMTGCGDDRVSILQTDVQRGLYLDTGRGNDNVTLSSMTARNGRIKLGSGNDRLFVNDVVIEKSLHVDADAWFAGGDDWIEFTDVEARKLVIKMGAGDDEAMLTDVTAKKVIVDGGRGQDELTTSNNNIDKLRVKKVETR